MEHLSSFSFYPVEFGTEGQILKPEQVSEMLGGFASATDLVVISHGWNNDMAEAHDLYARFFATAHKLLDGQPSLAVLNARSVAVMGVFWPSKRFTDQDLIPGGMAGIDDNPERELVLRALDLLAELNDSNEEKKAIIQKAKADVGQMEADPAKQDEWVKGILSLIDDKKAWDRTEEGVAGLLSVSGSELLDKLSAPVIFPIQDDESEGGALSVGTGASPEERQGGAAGLGSLTSGVLGGVAKLLNLTTYYTMKDRAGKVGSTGVHDVVTQVHQRYPALRIHLVGHSFGGRLVSALAKGREDAPALQFSSLCLLQAAFSHYGFSNNAAHSNINGFFRPVVTGNVIQGPMIFTHSKNDMAVGYAYAVASRVAGQNAAALGDQDDEFGGIGRNGAQLTPEAESIMLLSPGGTYSLEPGRLHNLNGDTIIQGHGDVTNDSVVYACLTAIRG
jgi:hypothetical protein